MIHSFDPTYQYLSITEAIHAVRLGKMVLICDDELRENEADLCLAAQFATSEVINFFAHAACGLICVALSGERLDALKLPLMDYGDHPLQGTAFTTSVDARSGTTTGISAHDRAITIRALIDPSTQPTDLARPGHIFPLRACSGGTHERRGHTEAAVDLMKLASLAPGAVICEVLDVNGEAARGNILRAMALQWNIGIISVETIAIAHAASSFSKCDGGCDLQHELYPAEQRPIIQEKEGHDETIIVHTSYP